MFGIGGSEIIVILVIALLFLGPDKLPEASKMISKGIRDLKKQSRALQQQIENDEQIGGAIRDLKSALRGEDPPERPKVRKQPPRIVVAAEDTEAGVENSLLPPGDEAAAEAGAATDADATEDAKDPGPTLPAMAGEADMDVANGKVEDDDLSSLIKPASGAVAKAPAAKLPPPKPLPKVATLPKPAALPKVTASKAEPPAAGATTTEPDPTKTHG